MKLITSAGLSVLLLATISVNAQKKATVKKTNRPIAVVKQEDPNAEFKKLHPEVKTISCVPVQGLLHQIISHFRQERRS